MSEGDIQRWSREVAEDPGAPSFVPLARAYRKQGRRSAAREVVERGLGIYPEHLGAHSLLALIHVEEGDREAARDEWETVLRLDPENFHAFRGLGFLALERNDLPDAHRHLEHAARLRPGDPAVAEARKLTERRAAAEATPSVLPPPSSATGDPRSTQRSPTAPDGGGSPAQGARSDPALLFEGLRPEAAFLGGLLLDEQGRPLAGSLASEDDAAAELLGAHLHGVAEEAQRTTDLLGIGSWDRILIDGDGAILHASALPDGAMTIIATLPGTPTGWVVRLSGRARELAQRFLEASS